MAVKDWSTVAASNISVGGVSIAEGMSPAGVNNAMRAMMAELASVVGTGSSVYNIIDYGADPTGAADSTTHITAAVTAAIAARGIVYAPPGVYLYSDKFAEITAPIRFVGAGSEQTIFVNDNTYTGFAIRINDCWRDSNGEEDATAATTVTRASGTHGVVLQGFQILGDRAVSANGIQLYARNDTVTLTDIKLKCLNGHALYLGAGSNGLVRESSFYGVRVQRCGSATEEAIVINTGDTVGDGTNELNWYHCSCQFPFYTGLRITSDSDATKTPLGVAYQTRRIIFHGFMLHGQHTAATAPASHLCVIDGQVQDIQFYGFEINGSHDVGGTKYSCVYTDAKTVGGTAYTPSRITIYGDVRVCNGNGYEINRCSVMGIYGTAGASNGAGKDIQGYELIIAASAVSGETLTYNVVGPAIANRSFSIDSTIGASYLRTSYGCASLPIRISETGGLRIGSSGNSPAIYFGTDTTPEATITANLGSIYLKTDPDGGATSNNIWVKTAGTGDTGWRKVQLVANSTQASLEDKTNVVNTAGPQVGQMVFDQTTAQPLWKTSASASGTWRDSAGTLVYTPA